MLYPKLKAPDLTRETVQTFRGYNHNLRIAGGEFYDMENLCSDHFPVMAVRQGRTYTDMQGIQGILAKDKLCYVKENRFYYGDKQYSTILTDSEKLLVSMGAYVLVFPDKAFFNTASDECGTFGGTVYYPSTMEPDETGNLVEKFYAVDFDMCDREGHVYQIIDGPESLPPIQEDYKARVYYAYYDDSGNETVLMAYNQDTAKFAEAPGYVRITAPYIDTAVESGDGVKLTLHGEIAEALTGITEGIRTVVAKRAMGENQGAFIVVGGLVRHPDGGITHENGFSISYDVPQMDFVIESNNRLWGCKYGEVDGEMLNEIYCSKLGDFKNWRCYATGISTDSWTASVGTDGPFTGAAAPFGKPIFFKENCIHEIYGEYPANFGIQTTACEGVQVGSAKSIAVVDGRLYYKAERGVMVYDGSMPSLISQNLGDARYACAAAGALGDKYYIDMRRDGEDSLFVYDTQKGLWHREDGLRAKSFAALDGKLNCLCGDGTVCVIGEQTDGKDTKTKWFAVTGLYGLDRPDAKYITRMAVRLSLAFGARVRIFVEYDSSGVWQCLYTATGSGMRSYTVPMRIRRCDHFRLKLEGTGDCRVYAITTILEKGSELF